MVVVRRERVNNAGNGVMLVRGKTMIAMVTDWLKVHDNKAITGLWVFEGVGFTVGRLKGLRQAISRAFMLV